MPSRFTIIAMGLAAPLLLMAACEQEAQQPAEVEQTQEPETAETEPPEPAAPAAPEPEAPPAAEDQQQAAADEEPPSATEPSAPPAADGEDAAEDGEIAVVPPEEEAQAAGEQETAQAPDAQPGSEPQEREPAAQAPGEPSPEAQGVASVAAYVGRWAEDEMMCPRSYWTFTNLRLQSPEDVSCDIGSAEEQENGVGLQVACTSQQDPLAEPERGTMSLTFPNLPETDTMTVTGGPLEGEELTLNRCPFG